MRCLSPCPDSLTKSLTAPHCTTLYTYPNMYFRVHRFYLTRPNIASPVPVSLYLQYQASKCLGIKKHSLNLIMPPQVSKTPGTLRANSTKVSQEKKKQRVLLYIATTIPAALCIIYSLFSGGIAEEPCRGSNTKGEGRDGVMSSSFDVLGFAQLCARTVSPEMPSSPSAS